MLKYVGNGSWLPGVPARDLSDAEVKRFGRAFLLESGLYTEKTIEGRSTNVRDSETRKNPTRS